MGKRPLVGVEGERGVLDPLIPSSDTRDAEISQPGERLSLLLPDF